MEAVLNILMIDDHPIILEGYERVLMTNKKRKLHILKVNDCDQAIMAIKKAKLSNSLFDAVFIDIQLPESVDGTVTSGADLAILIKKELPKTKIIILTMLDQTHRLENILNTIPHDGLLVKSDITAKLLLNAFEVIMMGDNFYSNTVSKIKKRVVKKSEYLDEYNKKIIYFLSKGVMTKNLTKHISLSLSAIEKRKKHIKQLFDVNGVAAFRSKVSFTQTDLNEYIDSED